MDDGPPILQRFDANDDDAFRERAALSEKEMKVIEQAGSGADREGLRSADGIASDNSGRTLEPTLFDGHAYKCLSAAVVESSIIKAYRIAVRVEMLAGQQDFYADEALLDLLKKVVRFAEQTSKKQRRINPNHYYVQLESVHLDSEINLHLRSTSDTALAELLEEFARVDMSNRAKGRPSIVESAFVIDCTAIEAPKRVVKRKHFGAGGLHPRIRRVKQQRQRRLKICYNTHQGAFWTDLPVISPFLCLFHAIIVSAAHVLMSATNFYKFKAAPSKQRKALFKLVNWCKLPKRKEYAIEDYGDIIQAYYEQFHPGMFKIFAFRSISNSFKPFWMSGAENFAHPIVVYYDMDQRHYLPVNLTGRLFGANSHYCFKCKSPYDKASSHKASCSCRCINCTRVGPQFPCAVEVGFTKKCEGCCKLFSNRECYEQHIKKREYTNKDGQVKETSVCIRNKKCTKCGIVYKQRADKKPHRCDERWCIRCKSTHRAGRYCFMKYRPKSVKAARYIVYDFETTPEMLPDDNLFRFKHAVNMCVAYVFCTECINKGIWESPIDGWCNYCGDSRTYAWSSFEIEKHPSRHTNAENVRPFNPDVHYCVESDDQILPAVVDWLLNFDRDVLGIEGSDAVEEDEEDWEEEDREENNELKQRDSTEAMVVEESEMPKKGMKCESIVYAHCGSRYDHVICFSEILQKGGLNPKITRKGNRLMQIRIKKGGIVAHTSFRDSYNIMSIPLDSFIDTFGLEIEGVPGKLHFPHGFNRPENYHKRLQCLPELDYYSPGTKLPRAKRELEEWYEANRNTPFCLKETLARYCYYDVLILAHGIVKMRELFMKTTSLDISKYLTMPSACVAYFQSTLEKTITKSDGSKIVEFTKVAIVPEMGYERRENSSAIATNWLKWKARNTGWPIQHAHSAQGEKRVCRGKYAVDGYVRRPGHPCGDLVIEVYGCFWHGCPIHYPNGDDIIAYGRTVDSVRERDERREKEIIREGVELKIVWECEIQRKLHIDPLDYEGTMLEKGMDQQMIDTRLGNLADLQKYLSDMMDCGPIEVSDAFFGGRTGPEWLGCVANEGYTIKYKDVVSLYPHINFKTNYPIGHPTPKCWQELDVDWRCPADMRDPDSGEFLAGIIKGFVVPPKCPKWGVTVIPHRVGKRGCVDLAYECAHETDADRGFVFTLTHEELERSLECGYRVTKLFRAYLWPNPTDWSNTIFAEYIREWMRHKYHASGWPSCCVDETIPLAEREENKAKLFAEAKHRYGILLDANKMVYNPGLRFLAKQALNSLWGRLALRNRLTKTIITSDTVEISRYLNNTTITISLLEQVSAHYWMLCYSNKKEYAVEHGASNPIIALWTTSLARCHLLDQLRGVYQDQRRMSDPDAAVKYPNGILRADCRILYMDTDSVIYWYKTELGDPLLDGEHLGELKDEYPTKRIEQFWCLAPKAYALQLHDNITGKEEHAVKTRSITMDHNTAQKVTTERMKQMVQQLYHRGTEGNFEMVQVNNNFRAGRAGGITTVPMSKRLGPTLNKGVLRADYQLVPFGWKQCSICSKDGLPQCVCMFPQKPCILS